ncbi:PIG-L family deacetylase [Enteractinococcus fodinae]|uniref:LmbE family N-acetylglucosaminyl deacetylase n=1 Tax=Enteractinococcus fodinae TaxID=684663 RepID=A0ABU2AXQ2_9MICC|nr:PIG-L deacetylase family protein [Enteractinococcus fodinae]MDR7346132.1 LmbE family N-acetylglucosaminyl deacetylase [Enteractinococcus fodinae]
MTTHDDASTAPLTPLQDQDFKRVLVVLAHPDDAEYGTSAAVSMWTDRGVEVGYVLATAGEAGMQRPPEEARRIRAQEQRNACEIVGVEHLRILDFPDGLVEYGIELRRAIAGEIRVFQPDVVISGAGELVVPWGLDHADHRAVGLATIDAVRDAGNRWLYTEQLDEQVIPWEISTLLLTGTEPSHYLEISRTAVDKPVASLAAHEHYLADLPEHPAPQDFIPGMLAEQGRVSQVPYAMGFQVH